MGGGGGGGGRGQGRGLFVSLLLMSCDNEQHGLAGASSVLKYLRKADEDVELSLMHTHTRAHGAGLTGSFPCVCVF